MQMVLVESVRICASRADFFAGKGPESIVLARMCYIMNDDDNYRAVTQAPATKPDTKNRFRLYVRCVCRSGVF